VPKVREYVGSDGASPFAIWFGGVGAVAAAKIRRAVDKLERGLRPNVRPVGQGVFEAKIDYGPGYRVYFGLDGDELVILEGGGDKRTQDSDITDAKKRWRDYKRR
jgi:putative addiction module killer protein